MYQEEKREERKKSLANWLANTPLFRVTENRDIFHTFAFAFVYHQKHLSTVKL